MSGILYRAPARCFILLAVILTAVCTSFSQEASVELEISISEEATRQAEETGLDVPTTGRVFAIVSRGREKDYEIPGPRLRGKPHFAVGTMDNYYINEAGSVIGRPPILRRDPCGREVAPPDRWE
jgi:hypothetical protein